jgi:hypothetical protein
MERRRIGRTNERLARRLERAAHWQRRALRSLRLAGEPSAGGRLVSSRRERLARAVAALRRADRLLEAVQQRAAGELLAAVVSHRARLGDSRRQCEDLLRELDDEPSAAWALLLAWPLQRGPGVSRARTRPACLD